MVTNQKAFTGGYSPSAIVRSGRGELQGEVETFEEIALHELLGDRGEVDERILNDIANQVRADTVTPPPCPTAAALPISAEKLGLVSMHFRENRSLAPNYGRSHSVTQCSP